MFDLFNSFAKETFDTDSGKQIHNGIFANGIWQQRKTVMGTFTIPTSKTAQDFSKFGLTKQCELSFVPDHSEIPMIPVGVLHEVIHLYREISKTCKSEVYCAIVWDREKKDFFIHVPEQTVAAASISYTNTPEIYDNTNLQVVMDIHSHVNMSAFFSGTDLADEQATRYFGVIGKIDSNPPEMICRAASNGHGIPLDYDKIFDVSKMKLNDASNYTIPADHYARIKERVYATPKAYKPAAGVTKPQTNAWADDDYYYDYGYGKGTTAKKAKTQSTTAARNGGAAGSYNPGSPFSRIYTTLNALRYGTTYVESTFKTFADNSLDCMEAYLRDLNVNETTLHALQDYMQNELDVMFSAAIQRQISVPDTTANAGSQTTSNALVATNTQSPLI